MILETITRLLLSKKVVDEAIELDNILILLADDERHHAEEFGENVAVTKRFLQLIADKNIIKEADCHYTDEYSITSGGKMFIQFGGYCRNIIYEKLKRFQLWIGIFAFVIALIGFFRTL